MIKSYKKRHLAKSCYPLIYRVLSPEQGVELIDVQVADDRSCIKIYLKYSECRKNDTNTWIKKIRHVIASAMNLRLVPNIVLKQCNS